MVCKDTGASGSCGGGSLRDKSDDERRHDQALAEATALVAGRAAVLYAAWRVPAVRIALGLLAAASAVEHIDRFQRSGDEQEAARGFVDLALSGMSGSRPTASLAAGNSIESTAAGAARNTSFIDPHNVRFSQESAGANFSTGGTISELSAGLKNGTVRPGDVPPIRLVERDGQLFSLDNRRLEAFRRAGINVPYRLANPQEAQNEAWKFTTTNGGISIRIRGEK